MPQHGKLISIAVPFCDESGGVTELFAATDVVRGTMPVHRVELVCVDHGPRHLVADRLEVADVTEERLMIISSWLRRSPSAPWPEGMARAT